ncbi:TonB-dependent receptor [Rhabdobacter roseus]|uniref:Outer membrane cobalamin receptor n=1 Tax=Rhabdobacter roseus TaxID=1655419 RepID=A0A840THW6_9BACT|nr:TonB-dependent receptor plug domain-containing protein [Rhabdobacter roseus]MBB5283064.1 outer membrane cobalamin receptor [Rhabdobacter roseus]
MFSLYRNALSILIASSLPTLTWAQTDTTAQREGGTFQAIIVSASRTAERVMETPVTVEHITAAQLQRQPGTELISSLARYKGIDVNQSSWLITSFSTRGFNSSKAERVVQLVDYVDVTSPTASLYYGNWMGVPELDLASVDLIHGANSALYGSNALNGVLMMNTKDPFETPGLTASLRGGSRSLLDAQLRYARTLGTRWAFKLNANYFSADEFVGSSEAAIRRVTAGGLAGADPSNNAAGSPLGWNALNRYGDVGTSVTNPALTALNNGQPYRLYAPGYTEEAMLWARAPGDLFGLFNDRYKAGNVRINPSLHWKITEHLKAIYEYKYSSSNGIFQSSSRYAQRAMQYDLHRAELSGQGWFLRAYTVFDYGGKAYDLASLGNGIMNAPMTAGTQANGNRYPTFAQNYFTLWNQLFSAARTTGLAAGTSLSGTYLPNPAGGAPVPYTLPQAIPAGLGLEEAQRLASQLAAGVQVPVGSTLFNQLREQIVTGVGTIDLNGTQTVRGAAFANTARFWDVSGQKEWLLAPSTHLIAGASYRTHILRSQGTLLADGDKSPVRPGTNEVQRRDQIVNWEGGAYAQLRQELLNNRLRLAFAGRFDQFRNFGARFSPRISGVLSLGEQRQHNLRLNYAQAYRQPAQLDQFIYLDFGSLLVQGNIDNGYEGLNAVSVLPKGQSNPDFLKPQRIKSLSPEQVNTWEVGYKAQLFKGFYVDASYYRSHYRDFIGTLRFYGREDGLAVTGAPLPTPSGDFAKPASDRTRGRLIQVWANAEQRVLTQGVVLATDYFISKKIHLAGNYTWSHINEDDVPGLILGFNTPQHKFNLGLDGEHKQLMYSLNYRYQTGYTYFMPFDEGTIGAFGTVDAQLGYRLASLQSTLRLGGTNLTNANAIHAYGSAPIGRVVYLGWALGL